jgi:hypothetical protein
MEISVGVRYESQGHVKVGISKPNAKHGLGLFSDAFIFMGSLGRP